MLTQPHLLVFAWQRHWKPLTQLEEDRMEIRICAITLLTVATPEGVKITVKNHGRCAPQRVFITGAYKAGAPLGKVDTVVCDIDLSHKDEQSFIVPAGWYTFHTWPQPADQVREAYRDMGNRDRLKDVVSCHTHLDFLAN